MTEQEVSSFNMHKEHCELSFNKKVDELLMIGQETARNISETKTKFTEVPQARLKWNLVMDFDA
jgi:hypothetical protein